MSSFGWKILWQMNMNEYGDGEKSMKLEPEGKKRLESMKKTLAAGLPLAGLLAASAAVGVASEGCAIRQPMGRFPSEPQPAPAKEQEPEVWPYLGELVPDEPPEEWVLDGDIPSPDLPHEVPDVPAVPDGPVDEQKATPAEPRP